MHAKFSKEMDFDKVSAYAAALLPKTEKAEERNELLRLVPRAMASGVCVISDGDDVEQYGCMGVACRIGDNAFYFVESFDTVDEYMRGRDVPRIAADIIEGLELLRDEFDENEFAYYLAVLRLADTCKGVKV